MKSTKDLLSSYKRYFYLLAGVAWLFLSYYSITYLLLLPSLFFFVSFLLMYLFPNARITSAFSRATSVYGLALSIFQIYFSAIVLGNAFLLGVESLAVFILFGLYHVFLLYSWQLNKA